MVNVPFPRTLRSIVNLSVPVALAVAVISCCGSQGSVRSQVDDNAFIQMALQATCADTKNALYVVDEAMVLSDRAGSCPDASFAQVLYGTTISEVYCSNQDSVGGPVEGCAAADYRGLFDTMIANLAQPDLGLGPTHSIRVLLR